MPISLERRVRWRPVRARLALCAACAQILGGAAAAPAQTAPTHPWSVRLGVTFPIVEPIDDDFPDRGGQVTRQPSSLTFPRLTVSRRAGPVDLEAGYRKLGALRFAGAAQGNTHSNAGQIAVAWAGAADRGWRLSLHGAVQLIRTVATVASAPSDWPFTGGKNTFSLRPVIGVAASVQPSEHFGLQAEFEPVLGVLGTRAESGRYRQRLFAVDVVYRP